MKTYKITIKSAQPDTEAAIKNVLVIMIGYNNIEEINNLIKLGGVVGERYSKETADDYAKQLRNAGAVVEVEEIETETTEELFRVRLVSVGANKVLVIKAIRDLTNLGLKESKNITDELGVVGDKLSLKTASHYKKTLEAVGAKVNLESLKSKDPKNDNYLVKGQVRLANGEPASGVLVRAYDKDLRSEQYLGEASISKAGEYAIFYKQEQFSRSEKNNADLLLRVFNEVGVELALKTKVEGEPDIFFNSPKKMEINLQLEESTAVKASEYERLEVLLNPALDGATLAELSLQDINFLINETEISEFSDEFPAGSNSIHFTAQSAKLSREINIPAEAFYGWARIGLGLVPDDHTERLTLHLNTLLKESDKKLKGALEKAIVKIIIPTWLTEQIDSIFNQLQSLRHQKTQEEKNSWIQRDAKGILIDEASAEPLVGYFVRAEIINQDGVIDIEGSTTNVRGEFILTYALPSESEISMLSVVLYIKSPNGDELDKHELKLSVEQKDAVIIKITVPVPAEPGEELQLEALPISFSNDLSAFLKKNNLTNIAELRKLGTLENIKELPEALRVSDELKQLQAQVDLSLLSTDLKPAEQIKQNQLLIDKGFTNFSMIADMSVEQFASVIGDNGIVAPTVQHAQARYLDFQLNNAYLDRITGNADETEELEQDSALSCQCEDCVSALSPGAYLTDLLGYVIRHVETTDSNNRTKNIDLDFLVDTFHQPLSKLPINCAATKTQLRQVRIACEVLLAAIDTSQLNFVITDERVARYRQAAYQSLLRAIGTSQFDLDRASSDADIEAIANRLGIDSKYVQELQLQSGAHQILANALSEHNLERIFGLPAYMETYIDIDIPRVRLLDPLRFLKAEQKRPELYDWRLEHLKKQWKEMDFPESPLSQNTPIIDPDVIGPDDFRHPDELNTAFEIWKTRREWVDEQIARIHDKVISDSNKPNGLATAIEEIAMPTTLDDLIAQQALLTNDAKIIEDAAFTQWLSARQLSVEALVELARFASDVKVGKEYNEEEWQTYSTSATNIIVNSVKRAAYNSWVLEEANISLNMTTFWPSLTEPQEGEWSLFLESEKPLLDPENIEPKQLPDDKFGLTARALWDERRIQLNEKQKEYADILKSKMVDRLDTIMSDAFGSVTDIENINSKLNSLDQTEQAEAKAQILALNLNQESFVSLVSASLILNDTDQAFSDTIQNNLSAALVSAYKFNFLYSDWLLEEASLPYWQLLKARLPRWRASQTQRQQWQQTLKQASTPPLIDPDVISGDVLIEPVIGNFAYDTWRSRTKLIDIELNTIRDSIEQGGNVTDDVINPDAIEDLFSEEKYLGISHKDLIALSQLEEQGISITSRLQQISLAREAYLFLLDIAKRIEKGFKVLAGTRENMYAILLQIWKVKQFATWREEESNKLSLSPEFFKYPTQRPTFAMQQEAQKWHIDTRRQREWYRTLKARIDQQEVLASSLKSMVSEVEEQTLPELRDVLIEIVDDTNDVFNIKAKKLTKRFLIDLQQSGCQMTTRVGMALEVLQTLVFSIRSGKIDIADVELKISSKQFEQEWRWMGSYATWKAAMGVFLYPEQILYPSLRRDETSGFKKLSESIRNTTSFTDTDACKAFSDYFDYIDDVRNITVDATCYAKKNVQDLSECGNYSVKWNNVFYLFGKGRKFSGAYMSTYDWENQQQTSWVQLPYLVDVISIAGATEYNNNIILFIIIKDADVNRLYLMRQDLNTGRWEEPKELEIPNDNKIISAALVERINNQSVPIIAVHLIYPDNPNRISVLSLNSLNDDGTNWIDNIEHWRSSYDIYGHSTLYPNIESVIETEEAYYVFFRGHQGTQIEYIMKDESWPNDLTLLISKYKKSVNDFSVGAFRYPNTNEVYGVFRSGTIKRFFLGEIIIPVAVLNLKGANDIRYETHIGLDDEVSGWFSVYQPDRYEVLINNFAIHNGVLPNKRLIRSGSFHYRSDMKDSDSSFLCEMKSVDEFDNQIDELRFISTYENTSLTPYILDNYGRLRTRIPFQPSFQMTDYDYLLLRASSKYFREYNMKENGSLLIFIEELYYFIPLMIAIALSKSGNYQQALLWFRQVYNYLGLGYGKLEFDLFFYSEGFTYNPYIIYDGLEDGSDDKRFDRSESWLRDPINPHIIASQRSGTYKHFTIQSIIRCLLDYADAEFTYDTSESVAKARSLYQTALDLIQLELPPQSANKCLALIESLKYTVEDITLQPYYEYLKSRLGELNSTQVLKKTLVEVRNKLNSNFSEEKRLANALEVIQMALGERKASLTATEIITKSLLTKQNFSRTLLSNLRLSTSLANTGRLLSRLASSNSNITDNDSAGTETVEIADFSEIVIGYSPRLSYEFCIPNNPTVKFLLLRAKLNLFKIRNCMNIAGMQRELEPYSAPIDVESALPSMGAGGQVNLAGVTRIRPTQYRYPVLVDRAKQLTHLAQQTESSFFSTLQSLDQEKYTLIKARQDVELSKEGVKLQKLRVRESENGLGLAELQLERTAILAETYADWLSDNMLKLEKELLQAYQDLNYNQLWASRMRYLAQSLQTGASIAKTDKWDPGAIVVASLLGGAIAATAVEAGFTDGVIKNQYRINTLSLGLSIALRNREYELQHQLAEQDLEIGSQQIKLANDRVQITEQEQAIAEIQSEQASDTVVFLQEKFANVELYNWMSGVLQSIFRYYLQQASSMSKLAEIQLAFERQEPLFGVIKDDYYELPNYDSNDSASGDSATADRRGLTGSARLLRDITKLDQYAFTTDQRKQQLSISFSLSQLDPFAFQQFKRTGILNFDTSGKVFDRRFPGQYLRLIKQVRISVIALVPPVQGISATLTSSGISRVVIAGDVFQTVAIRRDPESIAFTNPIGASGVFELNPNPEMLFPFEGNGVDTRWEFRLPKASNPMDFNTIADVLFTVQYTALHDRNYQQQVQRELDPYISFDRAFSFRQEFSDAWYDLHNPEQTDTPMIVSFETTLADFPSNVKELSITNVLMYIIAEDDLPAKFDKAKLDFIQDGNTSGGVAALPTDGVIRSNANGTNWAAIGGRVPEGKWLLELPNESIVKQLFEDEKIIDILLVLTCEGELPGYPM